MKAITICQPYAHLIMTGDKWVENREWPTPHRGPLLIHAGKSRDWLSPGDEDAYRDMVFGAIVGIADLSLCITEERIAANAAADPAKWRILAEHKHALGTWCWVLKNVRRFPNPIPYRGAQKIFDIPDDVVAVELSLAVNVPRLVPHA